MDTSLEPTHHTYLCMCTLIIEQPVVVHDVDQQYDQANYAYANRFYNKNGRGCGWRREKQMKQKKEKKKRK